MANVWSESLEVGVYPIGAMLFHFSGPLEVLRTHPMRLAPKHFFSGPFNSNNYILFLKNAKKINNLSLKNKRQTQVKRMQDEKF